MRVIITARALLHPIFGDVSARLAMVLSHIAMTPVNPRFNHYAFESIGAIIKYCGAVDVHAVQGFEKLLVPTFESIISREVLGALENL
jgi:exportin-2 (importin alpha re-exporter)